ncbi:MAG: glycoside hydrolase family 15 protein, partial [Pyrinomonadaceae bacterium]
FIEFPFSKNLRDAEALNFKQFNSAKSGQWTIVKTYITDPQSNTLLMRVHFFSQNKNLRLYIFYNPSLANSGMGDAAWNDGETLLSQDGNVSSALMVSENLSEISNDFYRVNDGFEQLQSDGKISKPQTRAANGNVAQIAKINFKETTDRKDFTVALGFGKTPDEAAQTAQSSLKKGFDKSYYEYVKGWRDYVKTLPVVDAKYQAQFDMAAMVLRAGEDKTFRGGNVASLTNPWITGTAANEGNVGGYHLVWSRDLYQIATAYLALGDTDSANRALDYLFAKQQKPDGSYPQISWLDGRILGDAIQMDEVSYPLILAYQLGRNDRETYLKHIKPTADYIAENGPRTQQERWEEKPGFSPATIAAEIAGLVCAADLAQKNNDETSAKLWLEKADDWAKNIEKWTATTTGKYGDGNYYLRLTAHGTPDAGEKIELNNNAGIFQENEIVDAGFLELVRLGIKSPDDPLIVKSLKVVDEVLKVETPNGAGFYRYNHDGYGETADGRPWNFDGKYTGKGHLWALLSGERGEYELAFKSKVQSSEFRVQGSESKIRNLKSQLPTPELRLNAMLGFANEGLMIPEQIWDERIDNPNLKIGEGVGSATPLAWSMAQFIRLAVNLKAGKNLDTPEVVARRYGNLR